MNDVEKTATYRSIGGSSIDVILQFSNEMGEDLSSSPYVYLGSAISVSYSVYREKVPVYRLGDTTVTGFSIGKKTVAGSIVKAVMEEDEINEYLQKIADTGYFNTKNLIPASRLSFSKEHKTIMKDDLLDFNIILMFSSEYTGEVKFETVYGANIIGNGQVMSAQDLFTETTMSFFAKDVKQIGDISGKRFATPDNSGVFEIPYHNRSRDHVLTASRALFLSRR